MIGNSFARLTGSKRNLLALMASSAVFTAGCSNMASTAPAIVSPASSAAALGGKIHGGNQPVVGATVKLYFAGQKSGFPPTLGATTTTDAAGSFGFTKDTTNGNPADNGSTSTFSCPTSVGIPPLVYVISTGGNTQNNGDPTQNNAAAEFISVFGPCNTLTGSTFIDMTEVTTVATMAAYQGFFDPTTESIAADGTTQQTAIITAIPNTIALLANLATGASVTSTTLSASATGNINPAVTVTATPEPGKVNLLANILSACINTATASSAACTSLLTSATPRTPPIPLTSDMGLCPLRQRPSRRSITSSRILQVQVAVPLISPLSSDSRAESAVPISPRSLPSRRTGPSPSASPAPAPAEPLPPRAVSSVRRSTSTSTLLTTSGSPTRKQDPGTSLRSQAPAFRPPASSSAVAALWAAPSSTRQVTPGSAPARVSSATTTAAASPSPPQYLPSA
ncbi:hypothetical protein [Tunturiibacter gelidiferens]|uniref:hypothetical protein n=1 Tax=Tunturiibacter gelidiferens TaxID=3069689 RepID=UPI003D9AE6F7